jgi:hypothetical protein
MKTLDQVEARTPIDAKHTPGDANSLFIISKAGAYYLTGNVTGSAGKNGITVNASNITIDLNGFGLAGGSATSKNGILLGSGTVDVTIRNGTVHNWGGSGVDGTASNALRTENIRVFNNNSFGIRTGDNAAVLNCVALANGSGGFSGADNCLVRDSQSISSSSNGFSFGLGSLISNCFSAKNVGIGIYVSGGSRVSACLVQQNQGFGIYITGEESTASHCTVSANGGGGIFVPNLCTVIENHIDGNGAGAQNSGNGGIVVNGSHNRIESNELALNTHPGIQVFNAFNVIIKNTVAPAEGSIAYDIAAGNKVGVIIDAPDSPAIQGRSGGTGMGTNDPWANFTY